MVCQNPLLPILSIINSVTVYERVKTAPTHNNPPATTIHGHHLSSFFDHHTHHHTPMRKHITGRGKRTTMDHHGVSIPKVRVSMTRESVYAPS